MCATAVVDGTCPADLDLASSFTEVLASQVQRWSGECQRFLDWQRHHVLMDEATSELRSRHDSALRRLLALGRMLNAATSDPEFADRQVAALVKARLAQLCESWELTHPAMSAEEGEALLAMHFELRSS